MLQTLYYNIVYAGTEEMMQFGPPSALSDFAGWSILVLIGNILKFFLGMTGAIAIIVLVIAGFRLITSEGADDAKKKAISTIKWTVAGIILIIVSYSIVAWITGANSPLFNPNQSI